MGRVFEHREGLIDDFMRRYGLKRLVLTEFLEGIRDAIKRETDIKHWPCAWKVRLIHAANPDWCDLAKKDVDGRDKPTAVRFDFYRQSARR